MNQEDLQQIKGIVVQAIHEEVPRIINEQVPPMIEKGINEALEHVVMPQFDLIHSRIDSLEKKMDTQMASKGYVEERLDKFAVNHRLIYKPAT